MPILNQSFLGLAEQLNTFIHVRYSTRRKHPMDLNNGRSGKEVGAETQREGSRKRPSLVIIRQTCAYLEPIVRSMFEGAEDVRIVVDRRFHERRQIGNPSASNRRKDISERRTSAPMLDILIEVEI
jgi:hypothetical protein